MNYRLTQHARDAVAKRGIDAHWLDRVLDSPERVEADRTDPELEHWLGRIAECENRVLRVVVKPGVLPLLVITVYFDRNMRGEL